MLPLIPTRPRHYLLLNLLLVWSHCTHAAVLPEIDSAALAQANQHYQQAQSVLDKGDHAQALRLFAQACQIYEQQMTQLQAQFLPEDPNMYSLQQQVLGCQAAHTITATSAGQFTAAIALAKATNQRAQQWLIALERLPSTPAILQQQAHLSILRAELVRNLGITYSYQRAANEPQGDTEASTALKTAEVACIREAIALERQTLQWLSRLPQPLTGEYLSLQNDTPQYLAVDEARLAENLIALAKWYQQQERLQDAAPLLAESQTILTALQPDAANSLTAAQSVTQSVRQLWHKWLNDQESNPTKPSPSPQFTGIRLMAQAQLATAYLKQGDFSAAEQWQLTTLSEQQQSLGEKHPDIAFQLAMTGKLYQEIGVQLKAPNYFSKAEQYYQQSIELFRQLPQEANASEAALPLGLLSGLYQEQQRHDEAIAAMQQIVELEKHTLNTSAKTSPALRSYELRMKKIVFYAHLNMLGQMNVTAGYYPAAIQSYMQNLSQTENTLPPSAPGSKATSLYGLAVASKLQKNIDKALDYIQQAEAAHAAFPSDTLAQNKSSQELALQKLTTIMQGANLGILPLVNQSDTLFQTAQQVHGLGRLAAFRHVALRNANDNPEVQAQLTQLWEQQQKLQQLEQSPEQWASASANDTNADPQQLQQSQQQQIQTIQRLEADLRLKFPLYDQLAHPQPLSVAQVQGLLKPDEALLMWVENTIPSGVSYLFVVRADQPLHIHQLPITRAQLATELGSNAQGLRASLTHPEQTFDLATAHNLYRQLLAPAEADLVGVKHLIAVPDGLLQNLPLPVLLKSPPETASYQDADWLIKHYSISYLPSVNAIADLHTSTSPNKSSTGFMGFGDPVLQGKQLVLAEVFRGLNAPSQTHSQDTLIFPDTRFLHQNLVPLPETADELRHVAQATQRFSTTQPALYLQHDATETRLKQLNQNGELQRVKILSFATHALLPYEAATNQTEAGLVLTPPMQGNADDDGFLSSGEIAALKLNADWVLLSACNTATLNDTDTYAGLSALSKAFITAGSRSILASHWSVNSNATQSLVTDIFSRLQQTPSLSRAEALRQSMLSMSTTQPPSCHWFCRLQQRWGWKTPETTYAHPYYWAAFAIYGDWNPLP